jgi:hypothetical protein
VPLLALKLVLVPVLVLGASVTERRWGPRAAALLTSLPVISGPLLFFFAIEQGHAFAANAAETVLVTAIAVAAAAMAYAWLSVSLPWWASLGGSGVSFGVIIGLLELVEWSVWSGLVVVVVSVTLARAVLPARSRPTFVRPRPVWDLGSRVACAVVLILCGTALASRLGPRVSGVLAALPIALFIVVASIHSQQGRTAALAFIGSFIPGMGSSVAFSATIAFAIRSLGTLFAFTLPMGLAVAVQLTVLWAETMLASRRYEEPPPDRVACDAPVGSGSQ